MHKGIGNYLNFMKQAVVETAERESKMKAFTTGTYRNLFAEIGKNREEIEQKIADAVRVFFYGSEDERIYHEVGEDMA